MLALFSLPLPAMAMFSNAAGMNIALNSNGENPRGAIIPNHKVDDVVPDSITLNLTKSELHVGETLELIATVWPDSLSSIVNLVWKTNNQSVAEVNANGLVTAVGVGQCVVSVNCGPFGASCEITVKENEILAEVVELTPESAELEVGGTITLAANIYPENTTDKSLVWTSSDSSVASVDDNGVVTAVAQGTCKITATCGEVAGTCAITVKNPIVPAQYIELEPDSAVLEVGDILEITATVYPDNTTDARLTWKSSDVNVATVRGHGDRYATVTAKNPGECTITAECYNNRNGVIIGRSSITVKIHEVLADSVVLNLDSAMLEVGGELALMAKVYPENVTDPQLTWQSSDSSVASVDGNGLVTAVAQGSCVITATCGAVAATCAITVKYPIVPAQYIVLEPDSAVLEVGETLEITATVYPDNTTDARLTWKSSDVNVATVRGHGNRYATVTAKNPGECTITAECYNNRNGVIIGSSSITVRIEEVLADSVVLNLDSAMLAIGGELALLAKVYPEDVTDELTWQSSNEEVATVNQSGVVKAVATGECDVTATCGGISTSCHVQVYDPADIVITFDCDEARVVLNHEVVLTPSVSLLVKANLTVTSSDSTVVSAKVDDGKVKLSGVGFGKATVSISTLDGLAKPDTCEVVVSTLLGDVDFDGNLTISDLTELIDYMLSGGSKIDPYYFDIYNDGQINVTDLTELIDLLLSGDEGVFVIVPESVSLSLESADIDLGGSVALEAFVLPEDVTNNFTSWTSTDESVAKVRDGVVSAVGVGECSVVVMCKDQAATCRIEVHEIMPENVELSQHSLALLPGESVALTATVYPENTTNNAVSWTSTDESVAKVAEGKVTAVAVGDCYIIADCQGKRDTCSVNVYVVEPERVVLSQHSASLLPGESMALTVTVYPENTTNKAVTWTSTDERVAKVADGKVTAVAVGECYIIADCQGKRDTCSVNVHVVEPERVELSQHSVSLLPGANVVLTATVYPENTTDKTVTWSSTNGRVATVSGGKVTAVAVGDCYIIADCQGKRDTCSVNVRAVEPESIVLSESNVTMNPGSTITLTATVYPSNTTNKTVTWRSSNASVATVNNGVVNALATGECDIIATCQNVQATCHVTVKEEDANENTFTVNGVTFSMVPVEGGTFLMGTPATQTGSGTNERPQHFVTVSDYKIGQTEVTQALWEAVMGRNPSAFPGDPQRPVDNVSWDDCKEFIDSLNKLTGKNFRFPTEAEWEYAARGGNKSEGFIFAGSNTPAPVAWYSTNSGSKTQPVAQKAANELGLYDMSGNVCEWCSDWYVNYEWYTTNYTQPIDNPTGPETGSYKMLRGGSWFEVAKYCRSGYRNMQSVTVHREFIGLRLAL